MATLDIFNAAQGAFSLSNLTHSMALLPNQYSLISQLGLFKFKPETTRTVQLEILENSITLIPTTPWSGVAPKPQQSTRNLRAFNIPHTALEEHISSDVIQGVRAFGTTSELETLASKVNESLQKMKNSFDATFEYRMMNAMKGTLLDSDGTSVIYDYYTEFGVTRKTISFGLKTASTDVTGKVRDLVRHIETNLFGLQASGVNVLVSPEFFELLVSHAGVKAAYANQPAALQLLQKDMRNRFVIQGVTFTEYNATIGGKRLIDPEKAYAYPIGADIFIDVGAPASFMETVNTLALPMYAKQIPNRLGTGIDIHMQSNRLPINTRPGCVVELTA